MAVSRNLQLIQDRFCSLVFVLGRPESAITFVPSFAGYQVKHCPIFHNTDVVVFIMCVSDG